MSRDILASGTYILYDTTQRYRMLSLDEHDFFVWRGLNRLELSDMGHEAAVILHEGNYFFFRPEGEEFLTSGILHLACQEGKFYRVYALPQGIPSERDSIVDIIEAPQRMTPEGFFA